ncbi:MAG: hypothetical protein HUU35_18800, partial [Armatimonadetes bacterium]|nr:hypothetical protein [Armatimonadota bacterium]
ELAITPARVPGGGEFTVQVPGGAGAALSSRGDGEATGAPVMMACQLARGLNTLVFQPRGAGELALDVVELRYRGWPASWMVGAVVAGSALLALLLALLRRRARR